MPAIHILYEAKDHQNKAIALMNALNNNATIDPVDAKVTKIQGLKTLIFWGHGSATGLCDKTGEDIVKIINRWKGLNNKLDNVSYINIKKIITPEFCYCCYQNRFSHLIINSGFMKMWGYYNNLITNILNVSVSKR